jgi:photosystem II stability/assembly factor-like uncharacterized protein
MIRCISLFPYSFTLLSLQLFGAQPAWLMQAGGTTASLRGIGVIDRKIAWASGTEGTFLRTTDGGHTWKSGAVSGASKLDFRGLHAFDASHAILMSSGPGALSAIYETRDAGQTWSLIKTNPDPKGFFDAIAFASPDRGVVRGIVLGDPVDGEFVLLTTYDAGLTWQRLGFPALEGESAFAASNTSLVIRAPDVWIATGGKTGARVIHLESDGTHCCRAVSTPIRHDSDGAGIFSIAFSDAKHGIAVGGDYAKPRESAANIAVTMDGGATWTTPSGTPPRGYRSAVAWLPQHKLWITTGPSGSEFSRDWGRNWIPFDQGSFNAIGVGANDACWAVGANGRIAALRITP